MSLNNDSVWATCSQDILVIVLNKLDIESVVNCRDVNMFWRDVVEYYIEHYNLWPAAIQHIFGEVTFTEKSLYGWRDKILSGQRWLSVCQVGVNLRHHYKFAAVQNVCVYRVNWYQETSSLIAELNSTEILKLSLTNKLHTEPVDSDTVNKIYITRPFTYKVHLNSCYVISESVLWVYTAKPNRWDTKRIAKYYGDEILLHSIHIHNENVYVLLTKGDVLLADLNHNKFKKIFHLTDPLSLWGGDSVPFMFGTCILLRNVLNAKPCEHPEVNPYRKTESLSSIYRDEVTCVLEHGHVVLLGYRDGDIEIYLYKKLIDSGVPEVKFNLQYFIDGTMHKEPDLIIRSLDIYDDDAGHHLFVSTYCNVYEVLLSF